MSITEFSKINVYRSKLYFPQCNKWSLAEWTNALAGEAGEACNITKKALRSGKMSARQKTNLGKELADVITYACLTASFTEIDIEKVLTKKFNEVTKRVGGNIFI